MKEEEKKLTPQERRNSTIFIVVIVVLIIVGIRSCGGDEEKDQTPEEKRKGELEKCLSGWDGSHIEFTKRIKEYMNDPGSYEHVSTKYWDYDSMIRVETTFSGKNAFGGRVKNTMTALCDLECNVLSIAEGGSLPEL